MKKILILIPAMLLAACDGDYEYDVCQAATQGLDRQIEVAQACREELWHARFQSAHHMAQKYRNMPR